MQISKNTGLAKLWILPRHGFWPLIRILTKKILGSWALIRDFAQKKMHSLNADSHIAQRRWMDFGCRSAICTKLTLNPIMEGFETELEKV